MMIAYDNYSNINFEYLKKNDIFFTSHARGKFENKVIYKDNVLDFILVHRTKTYYPSSILFIANGSDKTYNTIGIESIDLSVEHNKNLFVKANEDYSFGIKICKDESNNLIMIKKFLYIKNKSANNRFFRIEISNNDELFFKLLKATNSENDLIKINELLDFKYSNVQRNFKEMSDLFVNTLMLYSERSFKKIVSRMEICDGLKIYFNPRISTYGELGDVEIEGDYLDNKDIIKLIDYLRQRRYFKVPVNPMTGKHNDELRLLHKKDNLRLYVEFANGVLFSSSLLVFNKKYDLWFPCTNEDECKSIKDEYHIFKELCK